ncbi:GDSL esterase/lipase [Carex littledalei]|uniref:GDSL esterase/lipase n=1 Tax=Carex littledalei TaxID=544730 RepID=A0A833QM44_9POAL|nr:GDSL esterase/lipase [Carex littledalei]
MLCSNGTKISTLTVLLLISLPNISHGWYTRIFTFGDSLTDTGNFKHIVGNDTTYLGTHPPYGETYFGRPTGRYSNGRVFADFFAEALGFPFPIPYLDGKTAKDFQFGANFAVGGATAMNHSFFKENGISVDPRVGFLALQIQWFKQLLKMVCSDSDCSDIVGRSFFLVSEIGVNDYLIPSTMSIPFRDIYNFVPGVISAISSSIKDLIDLGAKTLVVPGIVPFDCTPFYLTMFQSQNKEEYEQKTGCIKWLNEFSSYHDKLLQDELHKLRQLYPYATILYADYCGASIGIFESPKQYGFDAPLVACCGGEGPYNFSRLVNCGDAGSRVCADPSKYVSFDGFHLTDTANKMIVHEVLKKLHKKLTRCKSHPRQERELLGFNATQELC